ncbi:MAG: S-layer homology domain-containing protein [Anaerovoracaceae bacterium]
MKSSFSKSRKRTAIVVIACMIMTMIPGLAFGLEASDISGHWAEEKIQSWIDQELIKGYEDGTFKPENNITRAEFMTLVNGAFDYTETEEISFSDVAEDAWYAEAVKKAKAAGYITGYPDNTMRPDSPISREEAATIITGITQVEGNPEGKTSFTDDKSLSWSRDAVAAVSETKIMNGYPDGSFMPQNLIKRGEAVVALDGALSYSKASVIYDEAGTYGPAVGTTEVEGDVIVLVKDVTLRNMVVKGNLIVSKNVGDGDVTLDSVTVKGESRFYGGGENSIIIIDSTLGNVTIYKENDKIRIVISGSTTVEGLEVNSGAIIETSGLTGSNAGFQEIILDADEDDVIVLRGTFGQVDVQSAGIEVQVPSGSTVNNLILNGATDVTGTGTITNAQVNAGGVSFETEPKKVETATGITPPVIEAPAPVVSGGGGGGSTSVAVSAISVNKTAVTLAVGATETLVVTFDPTNATNKNVTWTTSDEGVATVANGVVTAVGEGTATITATSNNGKTATCAVTVEEALVVEYAEVKAATESDLIKDGYTTESVKKVNYANLEVVQDDANVTITGKDLVKVTQADFPLAGFGDYTIPTEGISSTEFALIAWMVGEEPHIWIIGDATKTFNVTWDEVEYTIDVEGLNWGVEPIESEATITLDGEEDYTNEGYDNEITLADGKVTGTLAYHEEDPTGMGFGDYEHHFMVFKVAGLADGATVTIEGKENGVESITTYTLTKESEVFVWGVEEGEDTITITVDKDGAGEAYTAKTYTLDLSEVTLEKAPVEPIESEATITLDGEEDYTNEGYDNEITLADGKVTGTLAYHEEDPTGMGFGDYEHHFMVFKVAGLADGATVTIEGKENGVESITTYTLTKESEVFVWGVEEGEDTITITVDKDGAGEAYTAKTYTLDLSEVTLEKAPVEPIESEATITLDGEEDYTNEGYDNEITLADGKVTGTLAYHEEDPTGMGFGDYEHHFMVFKVAGLADGATVTIEGKENGVESITTYTLTKESEVFVWGVEEGEDTITITVDKDGAGEAYTAKTYTLDLSEVTLEKAPVEPIESEATITLDGEEDYTNEGYDNEITLADGKVTGTLAYHEEDPTGMGFGDYEHHFMVFKVAGLADGATVTIEGKENGVESITTYTLTKESEVFVWGVEEGEDTITITVDKDGAGEAYTAKTYTLDLSEVTLEKAPVEPIESEATITLDGEEDYTNEGYDNEITLADGKVTGTLAYHEEDPTGMGFGDYEHHFMVFKVAGLADGATVTIEGKENGVESITTYTLTKESEVFVWGVEEGEDTITITVDKDGAGEAYTAKTYTLDLSEVTLEKAPVEPIESEATITLDGEEDYTNEGYDNEITLADGKVTGTLAYHEEDPTGMGFGDYEHHFMVFKVAGLADGATVTIEGKENGVESITTYTLTKESEVFVWGVEEGEDTITITVDKDGAGEAYTAKTYTLDLSEVTLEKAPVEPIESEATITLDGEEDYTNEGYDNEITLADGKVTGTLAYHEEDPTGMGFGDYEHHFMVFKVAGLADGATVTIEGKENGVESITTYTLTKESEVFVWGVEEGEDTITITVDKDGAGEAYTAKTYTLDLSEVTLEKAPVEPIESEATITLDGEEDYTNEGYDNEITLADGKVTGTLAYHEEDPTGMGFGDYEHHFMVFKVAGLADGATVTIEGKENGVESITTYTLTKESEVFVWGVEEGEDTITITVDKDGAGEAYTAKTYTLDLSEVTLEKAPVEPIESEATITLDGEEDYTNEGYDNEITLADGKVTGTLAYHEEDPTGMGFGDYEHHFMVFKVAGLADGATVTIEGKENGVESITTYTLTKESEVFVWGVEEGEDTITITVDKDGAGEAYTAKTYTLDLSEVTLEKAPVEPIESEATITLDGEEDYTNEGYDNEITLADGKVTGTLAYHEEDPTGMGFGDYEHHFMVFKVAGLADGATVTIEGKENGVESITTYTLTKESEVFVWGVEEGEDTITITVDKDGAGEAYTAKTYTLDLSEVTLEKAPVEPIESEATITLDGEEDYTNEGYDNEITLADGKVTGTLAYHEEDPTGMGFGDYEHHFMVFKVAGLADGATVTIEGKENGVESITTYTLTKESEVFVWGVEEGEDTITITVDKDGAGEAYTAKTYTLDLSEVTLEKAPVEPIESEATITLDGEEDYTNEGYDNEITLADGKVTGTLAYHEEDPTGMGFGDYEHHFMVFKVAGLADGATVTIEGKENGVESITTYTLTKESEVFVWGVEEGEDTITITVDKDGAGEAYTAKTYTLDLSEVTLEKAPVEPIESEATITLDGEEDYTNEGYDNEITLADGKVTGTLAYHEEDPTGMGFGDYEHHFMVFKVAGLADGATVTIEGKENGVESITTYTLTKESEVFVWGVEEGEDTITITVDKDGAGEAYTAKTYTLDLSEVTLEKAPVEPIESEATITLDGEEDYTNEGYDNEITLADGKVTGTLAYHEEDPTGMGFGDYEHHFMVFKVAGLADGATVTIEGKENGVESITTYTLTKESEVFVWGVEEGEDTITITVDKDGAGEAYTAKTYTLDLSEVTLEKAPVEPIESEATITLDGEEDYTNEGYDNEITLADGKVTGTLAYHEEDPTGMGFGDYEHHFMVFKVAGLADGATVTIEGKENGVESITTYTLTKESEVFVWGVEEGEDTITITVDKDGAGEAYTAKTYTLDLSEVTLEKAPVEPIESEATITLDGEEDYTNEGYDNEITLADGKVTGTLAYHEEDPTGMGFGDYEHHFMVFKVAGLADGATVTIEGKENGVESITTYTLTKESEVFVWGVEEGEDTITITVDKDGAGEAYTAKTYTLDLSEVTLEKAPVEPIESEATITLDGEEDYTNEGYDNEITLADGKVTGTLAYHEEDPTGMGFGDYEHHFMVFKVAGLADGATVTIEGKENGVESITTYTLTKESEVFVWGVEEGEDTITITVDKDGAGEAYTAKTYTLDLSEVTLEKAPVEPIESEATITLDGEEDYTNEGYDNEITLADGKVTGTLAYHEEDPTGMGFGDYEHHFMVFKVAGLADGATVTIEGKENGVESITTYTLTKESEVFVWGVEEGEDTITITVDKDGAGEAYTAKTYTLDLSEVTLEKAPVEPIESEATITLDGEEDYTNEGYDNEITLADGKVTGTLAYHEEDPTGMGFGDYEHHFMVFKVAGLADGATVTIEGKENGVESITTYTLTKESEVFVWGVEEGEDTITITVDKDGAGEAYTAKTYTLDLSEVTLEKAPVEPIESEATITLDGEEDYTNEGYDNEITLADGKVTGTLAYHEEDPTGMGFGDYEHHFMVFKVAGLADGATVTIEGKENGVESITTYTLTKESEVFVWGVEEGEDTITITVDKDGAGEAYTAKTYTLDLSEVTLEKAPVEPIESEATITLDGEEDYTNEGYDNEITLADGKVTGTLAYHEEDPTGMGFGDYEHHFMVFKVAGLADGATVTIEGKENGVESITTYTLTKESEVFVWGVEEGEDTITITVDKDGAGEAYTAKTYTLDLSEVTLEKAPVEPIESEATITLDGEEDYTNEGYDNEITLADGKVTGTLAYHEEDPTGMGFGDYEHHFMVFKVAGLADGATVTIEGKENGVESITTYTLTKESEVFVWGVEEGEDTITITVDKDGAGEAYTAKTYTLDLSEVTLEKAPVEPIESEATITLDGEEDYTNEGYDNEITLADGKVTGTLAYHEEDPTGMGFGDYEHHFMVFKVAGLADGATVTIEGKENGVESITTYTLTKESEVFVWGVEEGEDTITITVDKDGAGEAYTAKTYTLDLSEVTLEKAPVEPIESEATITLDGEEDYTNEGYDNEITLADGKVTGTLAYHEEDPTGMGFGDYEHHFMVFKVAGLADGATVTIEGKENGVESITTYTLTKESEVFVWGVEEGEDTITITVDKDGAGEAYTAKTYTLDLSEVTLEKAPVEPIESEATITLDGEEDYTNEGYDNEITLADGKVTGTLAYHEEDPTGMGFGDYEHHFMVFKVAGLADGATVTIEGKENGVESITTYTLTKESEVFVWGVEEGEDTITITVDKDGAGEAYTAKTYTLDLSEVTLEKAPVEPIESEATITLDGEEDYTNEGYDNEITLADGKVTGTLAYHEEDPTGMGFGDYEHHFMVFKVAGLADGATVTIEGKENGVESITTYTLTKESEVFVWGVEEGEDTITITVDKDGAGEAYTAKTYTLDLSEVTLEKAPVEPIFGVKSIEKSAEHVTKAEGITFDVQGTDITIGGTIPYQTDSILGHEPGNLYELKITLENVAKDTAAFKSVGSQTNTYAAADNWMDGDDFFYFVGKADKEQDIVITIDNDGDWETTADAVTYTIKIDAEATLETEATEPVFGVTTIEKSGEYVTADATTVATEGNIITIGGTIPYQTESILGHEPGNLYELKITLENVAKDTAAFKSVGSQTNTYAAADNWMDGDDFFYFVGKADKEQDIVITIDNDGDWETTADAVTYTIKIDAEATLETEATEPVFGVTTIEKSGEYVTADATTVATEGNIITIGGTIPYQTESILGHEPGNLYELKITLENVAKDTAAFKSVGSQTNTYAAADNWMDGDDFFYFVGKADKEQDIVITIDNDGDWETTADAVTYTIKIDAEATLETEVVAPVVEVISISVSPTTMTLKVGETGKITATIEPDNATNKKVNWSTSDENVVTVAANGTVATVTAVAEGTATITVKSEDGGFAATTTVTVEAAPEVGTKAEFLAELDTETAKLAPVATVTRDGESLTVNFRSDVEPSDVLDAAVGLAEALGNIADPTSTLTVGDITITLGSATPEEIIELATALLGGKTPAEFLAAGETITSAYTASIDYKGGTFDLDGSLNFTVTKVGTKAEFLDELDEATEDLEVATVTRDGDNLTVNFRSDVEPSDVLDAAVGLAEALGNIADPTSTLTVGDITITLGSATSEEIIELATALLGGKTPAEFLAAGETITSAYTASIDYKGGTFDLDGSLNFTVTKVGTKAEFLDELDEATEDLEVATVTRDGDNLTVNFRSDVEPSDVLDAAVGLAEALGNIADPTSTLTVGDITITLGSATSEEIIELATALLGGKTPAEFLAAGETITSAYTASIDYKGGTFDLDGSLNFTVTKVGTKAEFLDELDEATEDLEVATVTRDGDNLTVNFRSDVEPSDVLDAAVGLAEALGNIADPTSTLTVGDITITLGSATSEEIIELATALLGGKTPAEFLAAGETITSAYTASIDYKGGTFDLDGSLNFTVTKVGTKAEFLDELDEATEDLEVATVTRDGDNLTVNFRSDVEPSDVLDAAVGLAEALGNIADPTSTLTVGDITITLGSATSEEIIELATALLGGKTPAEFLAAGETITSAYTASIDYKGGTFDLDGTISFTAVQ